jgi:hypothetical protein
VFFLPLGAALIAGAAPIQESANRSTVESAATSVEQHYYDSKVAAKVAADLRRRAAAGEFDRLDPPVLAGRLTSLLSLYDRHFAVEWTDPTLSAQSGRSGFDMEVKFRRSGYGIRSVGRLPGNIGYLQLSSFAPIDFSQDLWPAKAALEGAIAVTRDADAIIIDLRDNNGGDPGTVGYLLSAFLPKGLDAYTRFQAAGGAISIQPAKPLGAEPLTTPLYILTSHSTGSAAEGFAYALQAAHRAKIIGERTAGGANPGDFTPLGSGYSIFISFAKSMNPLTHTNWEGAGVTPDAPVASADALVTAERLALKDSVARLSDPERIDAARVLETLNARAGIPFAEAQRIRGTYGDMTIAASSGALLAHLKDGSTRTLEPVPGGAFAPVDAPSERWLFIGDGTAHAVRIDHVDGTVTEVARVG